MIPQLTYCRICEAACSLEAQYDEGGQLKGLKPHRSHPVSQGFVCAKGTRFLEVADHPSRLLRPMKRTRRGMQPITWDEAYNHIRQKIAPLLERHGPHSVGIYFGNPLAFNALGVLSMFGLMAGLGSRNVFTAGSQDCNNKLAGAELLYGTPVVHPIPDFEAADLALMFGTNPAVSQSSFVHLEGGARSLDRMCQRGGRILWFDVRRTESAQRWGEYQPIRPGADIYLLLSLLQGFRHEVSRYPQVEGLLPLLALASHFPPDRASQLTGIPAATISALLRELHETPRVTFHMSVGLNQGPFGTLAYVALQALALLSGNLDREGGLLFHPLALQVSALLKRFERPKVTSRIGGFPAILRTLPGGILADEILTPGPDQIRALLVVAGNPLRSIPGERRLREAFASLDALVCVDLFANETGQMADLLLPSTSWLERWDVATTTAFLQKSPLLQYASPLRQAPGETRHEADILYAIADALHRPLFGQAWLARLWRGLAQDRVLSRLSRAASRWLGQGDLPAFPTPAPRPGLLFKRGKAQHPLCFWSHALEREKERLLEHCAQEQACQEPTRPFRLLSRRRRIAHNSWLHGGKRDGNPESSAWMSPQDLEKLGVQPGQEIAIESPSAKLRIRVQPDPAVHPGTVVLPHGLPDANVNALIPSGPAFLEPASGQHLMTGTPVQISAVL